MSKDDLYYTPMSNATFKDIKKQAMAIWKTYDDQYGYGTNKLNRIKDLTNIQDNALSMIAMFDQPNQAILKDKLSHATNEEIDTRIDWFKPQHDLINELLNL